MYRAVIVNNQVVAVDTNANVASKTAIIIDRETIHEVISSCLSQRIDPSPIWINYPEFTEPDWPVYQSHNTASGWLCQVIRHDLGGSEKSTTLSLKCSKSGESDQFIFLTADNNTVIDVPTMSYLGSVLSVDVSDYSQTGEHDAMQYLVSKGVDNITLIGVMVSFRESLIDEKLGL